ncbi:MAG: nucleotide exchange factor GrpE [Halobacteriales archaeon]
MSNPSEQDSKNDSEMDVEKLDNTQESGTGSEISILSSSLNTILQNNFQYDLEDPALSSSNKVKLDLIVTELTQQQDRMIELESMLKRAHADHQNYKKRKQNQYESEKLRSIEGILFRLFDLREGLVLLSEQYQNENASSSIGAILANLDSTISSSNVSPILPSPGDQVDPHIHEVFSSVEGSQPPGTIEFIHRIGYSSNSKILRPAQVSISSDSSEVQ